ncbi:DUF535 domain-containing protein, partial [Salmonella enterica]|nr:DUF535 domain-containing protein [Salmonella enterica]
MTGYTIMSIIKRIIFKKCLEHERWDERKFRFKFYLRCLINPVITISYFKGLCSIDEIDRLLNTRPLLPAKIQRPYLYKGLPIKKRAKAILDHYYFVQNLLDPIHKKIFLSPERTILVNFKGKDGSNIEISCCPCGYDREGETTLTYSFNGNDLVRLSFSFIRCKENYIAFIGGLQGPHKGGGGEIIRQATRSCYGLFPKRILYETFVAFIRTCSIKEVYAVSEYSHVYRQLRYLYRKRNKLLASYSEFWESIGGVKLGQLYQLPVEISRKKIDCVVSKKRS